MELQLDPCSTRHRHGSWLAARGHRNRIDRLGSAGVQEFDGGIEDTAAMEKDAKITGSNFHKVELDLKLPQMLFRGRDFSTLKAEYRRRTKPNMTARSKSPSTPTEHTITEQQGAWEPGPKSSSGQAAGKQTEQGWAVAGFMPRTTSSMGRKLCHYYPPAGPELNTSL
ncbi:hypothetical protein PAHAL_5G231300 [Panicum hallii]|uniref:Uncharacterized protein n=1 Tax=Panicum hallii TaxID=206008 RepID=A0A2T8IKX7_9POAL|nr:hypothetical protein PAHAL_5G231300 [Panicum hallii]